ncbi:MAG TPA: substrate-binding domain-containing protein [Bryobacteraceae bacterium]|nr:substrate-binding domain-containing protein [Bryobacteraceae bacterium]
MKLRYLLALGVCACTLASCSGSRHDPNEKYYLVTVNVNVPYWQTSAAGLARAAKDVGVLAEVAGPDGYDPAAEHAAFQNVLGKKPAGILVSAADANLLRPDIDAAAGQGVPVIAIDSDAPASKRLFFIGTNNYQAGFAGGHLVAKLLGKKGEVVVYTMPGQLNLEERLHGYRDAFAESPGIHIAQIIDIKGDPRVAFDSTEAMVEKDKVKADGFVCLEAIACKEVADVLNRKHITGKTVVAMDTDKDTLDWIQKGVIAATIAQKPYTMAYFGLKMLDDAHHSKLAAPAGGVNSFSTLPVFVDTGTTLIDKNNVDEFLKASATATANSKT